MILGSPLAPCDLGRTDESLPVRPYACNLHAAAVPGGVAGKHALKLRPHPQHRAGQHVEVTATKADGTGLSEQGHLAASLPGGGGGGGGRGVAVGVAINMYI